LPSTRGGLIRANAEQSHDAIMKDPELKGPLGSGALNVVTGVVSLN
jgi:hypothetical protein